MCLSFHIKAKKFISNKTRSKYIYIPSSKYLLLYFFNFLHVSLALYIYVLYKIILFYDLEIHFR